MGLRLSKKLKACDRQFISEGYLSTTFSQKVWFIVNECLQNCRIMIS